MLLILPLLLSMGAMGQSAPETAFKHGENLVYVVSYKVMGVNTDVAEVSMTTREIDFENTPAYHILAHAQVYPFFRWFFNLNDKYNSYLDRETLRPIQARADISEGDYRFYSLMKFDWDDRVVRSTYRNLKRTEDNKKEMALSDKSFDGVSLFYNLRCEETESFVPNKPQTLSLVLEDTIRTIRYKFLGKETKNFKKLGKFRTLKFSCQLATSNGESFEDGSEFFLWISDDENKIPLYIESPIRVGSIRARLATYENLKYPLDSKIK